MGTPSDDLVSLDTGHPIWDRFFTVSPLVVVGTREGDGHDLAPKHMATPLGWSNYFGFVCSPGHATYRNARREGAFTVSFPRPEQVVVTSLTASPRCPGEEHKPQLRALATFPAREVDGVFLEDAYLFLACELDRVVDGFGESSLVAGRVVGAHVRAEALRSSEAEDQEVLAATEPLVYLSPGRWARVEESAGFPFPAGFRR